MKIEIDRQKCVGLGECVDEAPAIFKLDSFGKAVLREQHPADTERTLAAARSCPVDAIIVFDDNDTQIYP